MSKLMAYYTSLSSQLICQEFDRELDPKMHGAFFVWLDKTYNGFWTKISNRFYDACDEYYSSDHGRIATEAFAYARAEYFKTMIDYLPEFRKEKGIDESKDFINSLLK